MSELRRVNRRLRALLGLFRPQWRSLAERSAVLFLASGGLLLVTAVLFAVKSFTGLSTQGTLTGVTGFTGVVFSYVGLLGLYPWFADRAPRAARVGFVLVALPTATVAALLVWATASHLPVGAVPFPIDVVPVGSVLVTTFFLFACGVGVFGVVSLRTGVPSRTVGALLLSLAATWAVLLGASSVYGSKFPAWLDFATFAAMAVVLTGIGYLLRVGTLHEYTGDPT